MIERIVWMELFHVLSVVVVWKSITYTVTCWPFGIWSAGCGRLQVAALLLCKKLFSGPKKTLRLALSTGGRTTVHLEHFLL